MRVLVTGASGFIGSAVMAELAVRGDEGVPFDRPGGDILDPMLVRRACADTDAVIHLAGVLGTSELLGNQHEAVRVNITGALNVLECAQAYKIPVVQIGTGHKGQPNTYAITKAAAEDLALARAQWNGEQIAVVRAYHVYGPGQKPPRPWGYSPVRKIIPALTCQILSGRPPEVYGSGNQRIDLVHVSEVARVLCDAIDGPYGTVLEAGTGKPVTVNQAAADLMSAIGARLPVTHLPMRQGEPPDTTVVASAPACPNPWPYRLTETINWLRSQMGAN